MSEFLNMGGYAVFVWSSYGLSAVVLIGMVAVSLRRRRDALERVSEMETNGSGKAP